jgi:hypothetical protein
MFYTVFTCCKLCFKPEFVEEKLHRPFRFQNSVESTKATIYDVTHFAYHMQEPVTGAVPMASDKFEVP